MNKQQIIALAVTTIIAVCCLLTMTFVTISVDLTRREWPPVHENDVALVEEEYFDIVQDEFVPVQSVEEVAPAKTEIKQSNKSTPAPTSGHNLSDAGKKGQAPAVQTTQKTSPVKQTKKEETKPVGPSKEELEQQEARRRANSATASAFQQSKGANNTSNSGKKEGDSGSPSGTSSSFNGSGTGDVGGGWVMPRYNKVRSTATGSIKTRVTIDRQGNVMKVEFIGGEAPASTDNRLRSAVEKEIRSHKFTRRDSDAPDQAKAYITYTFK